MKKIRLFLLLFLFSLTLLGQEKGKIRGGVDLSIDNTLLQAFSNQPIIDCIGKSYTLSLNYNLTDNMNIGLKYINESFVLFNYRPYINTVIAPIFDGRSLLVDYNYYIHKKNWSVSPFIEFGAGLLYFQTTAYYESNHLGTSTYTWNSATIPKYNISELVATGIEFNHIRLSLEYLLLFPTTNFNLKTGSGNMNGGKTTDTNTSKSFFTSRLSLKIGFYIGGGNWKKSKLIYRE